MVDYAEVTIKNAHIVGTKSHYSKEQKSLLTTIVIQTRLAPQAMHAFLELQSQGFPVWLQIKSYQATMNMNLEEAAKHAEAEDNAGQSQEAAKQAEDNAGQSQD